MAPEKQQLENAAALPSALVVPPLSAVRIELGGPIPPAAISLDLPVAIGGLVRFSDLSQSGESGKLGKTEETLSDVGVVADSSEGDDSDLPRTPRQAYPPEYKAWVDLKQRCFNPRHARYADYGGRGITVCQRLRNNFEAFFRELGPRPQGRFTLERIDNNGHYNCGRCADCKAHGYLANCRWATYHDQTRNRRSNVMLTHKGVTLCLTDWAKRIGMDRMTLTQRLRRGWPVMAALSISSVRSGRKP